jgi:hypothetical protein
MLMLVLTVIGLLISVVANVRRRRMLTSIPSNPARLLEWAEQRVMPNGIDGTGTVLQFIDLGDGGGGRRKLELEIAIALPGRAPYNVRRPVLVGANAMAKLQVGMNFPVRVDAMDANRVLLLYGAPARPAA